MQVTMTPAVDTSRTDKVPPVRRSHLREDAPRDLTLLQCKVESEYALYLDRYTGQLGWLENPLSRSLQRRFAKQRVPTDNLSIDDASLLRDRHLDLHRALGASCFGDRWIRRLYFLQSTALQNTA